MLVDLNQCQCCPGEWSFLLQVVSACAECLSTSSGVKSAHVATLPRVPAWSRSLTQYGWDFLEKIPEKKVQKDAGSALRWAAGIRLRGNFAPDKIYLGLRKRRHCTGVKIPKTGKRGFRGQKTPISHRLRKGRFGSKNPHFSTGLHKENGDFSTQSALF